MIQFTNVTKHYKSNIGLDNVSVNINKGDFVFLVGSSGAGKSTFIKLILKELDADSGSIKVNGKEVTNISNRLIPKLRRNIGIVFQEFRLLPKMTVFENVAFAMEIAHAKPRTIKRQVPQALSLVGISEKAHKYPDELSAGEQQRVAIARAIVNNPTVLIADEPTGNLDPDTAWDIMQLLDKINLRGTTIVMVTHAKDIVDKMNKRVIAIEKGKIMRDNIGTYEEAELLANSRETASSDEKTESKATAKAAETKSAAKAAELKAAEKKTDEETAAKKKAVPVKAVETKTAEAKAAPAKESETKTDEKKAAPAKKPEEKTTLTRDTINVSTEISIDAAAEAIVKEAIRKSAKIDLESKKQTEEQKAPEKKDESNSEKSGGADK